MEQKFDGIIFDVDGTLWDATDVVAASYNKVFEREGIALRIDGKRLGGLFGRPMDAIFEDLFPGMDPVRAHELADACMEQENEDLETIPGTPYPGVVETLKALSEKMPVFIVSNCQKGYIEILIRWLKLESVVKAHLCFGDTGTSKGQTILRLMRENGLKNPVYVGDTQGDAEACVEAGIPVIYCRYGLGTMKESYAAIDTFPELLELV